MAESGLDAAFIERSLFDALIDIAEADPDLAAIEDQNRQPVTRRNLLLAACVLGRRLASFSRKGERVGLLLPNVNGVAIAFFALLAYGRTPALLNFTAGSPRPRRRHPGRRHPNGHHLKRLREDGQA